MVRSGAEPIDPAGRLAGIPSEGRVGPRHRLRSRLERDIPREAGIRGPRDRYLSRRGRRRPGASLQGEGPRRCSGGGRPRPPVRRRFAGRRDRSRMLPHPPDRASRRVRRRGSSRPPARWKVCADLGRARAHRGAGAPSPPFPRGGSGRVRAKVPVRPHRIPGGERGGRTGMLHGIPIAPIDAAASSDVGPERIQPPGRSFNPDSVSPCSGAPFPATRYPPSTSAATPSSSGRSSAGPGPSA